VIGNSKKSTFAAVLREYFNFGEAFDDFACVTCNGRVHARTRNKMVKFPDRLAIVCSPAGSKSSLDAVGQKMQIISSTTVPQVLTSKEFGCSIPTGKCYVRSSLVAFKKEGHFVSFVRTELGRTTRVKR
jgi:hypothetical protein